MKYATRKMETGYDLLDMEAKVVGHVFKGGDGMWHIAAVRSGIHWRDYAFPTKQQAITAFESVRNA